MTSNTFDDAMMQMVIKLLEIVHSTNVVVEGKIGNLSELPTAEKKDIVEAIKELSDKSLSVVDFRPEHYRLIPTGKAISHGGFVSPLYTNARVIVKPKVEHANLIVRQNQINEYDLTEYYKPERLADMGKFPDMSDIFIDDESGVLANPKIRFEYTNDKNGNHIVKPMLRVDGDVVKNAAVSVRVTHDTVRFNTLHDGVINIQRYLDELVVVDNILKHPTNYCDGVRLESMRVTGYARGASNNRMYQTPYGRHYGLAEYSGRYTDLDIGPFDASYSDIIIENGMFSIFDGPYGNGPQYFVVDSIEMVYDGTTYRRTFVNSDKRQTNVANMRKFVDNLTAKLYMDNHNFGIVLKLADGVDVPDFLVHIVRFGGNGITDGHYANSTVGSNSSLSATVPSEYRPYIGVVNKTTKLSVYNNEAFITNVYGDVESIVVEFVYLNNTYKRTIPLDKDSLSFADISAYLTIKNNGEYMTELRTTGGKIVLSGGGYYPFSFSESFIKSFVMEFEPNGFNPSQIVKKDGIVVDTNNWTITSTIVDASRSSFKTGIDLTTPSAKLIPKNMILKFGDGIKDVKQSIGGVTIYRD